MVRVLGLLSLARSGANGPEWTHEGPQNGPQFLREFWGRYGVLILLALRVSFSSTVICGSPYIYCTANMGVVANILANLPYLLYSKYGLYGEYDGRSTVRAATN